MHRSGRAGRNNATGDAYVIYEKGIDNIINRLQNKSIN
jgi:superfamily II DNA/RNA helicase